MLSDPRLISLGDYFKGSRRNSAPGKRIVLVQCVESAYYFGLFGQIASSLRAARSVRVEQYVMRSLNAGESKSILAFAKARLMINPLFCFRWVRLYESFCDGVGYRSTSLRPIHDGIDLYRAWRCRAGLTDKDALAGLRIDDIAVGDLLNDSFLRFKPAPTVDLKDAYLLILLWQVHRDIRRAKDYFSRVRPEIYLTSYCTYIQHGIAVRVAVQHGVRVYSFGNLQQFMKKLTLDDWGQTIDADGYARDFMLLDRQDERLAVAEQALSARLSGGVDRATAYMKRSAYVGSGDPVPEVRGAVVIFLHDFFDSPHIYGEMVFPDFWEWVCFTIETLKRANIRFFVKPHPNQITLSGQVLIELQQRYADLPMIPAGISNRQLAEAGMACAITVYGTVAHEMAFLGVPSIACAHHPHTSFEFCRTARTRDDYAELLNRSTRLQMDKAAMHRESLIFYYMHNENLSDEMKKLRDAIVEFWVTCERSDGTQDLAGMLKRMTLLCDYQTQLGNMMLSDRDGNEGCLQMEGKNVCETT